MERSFTLPRQQCAVLSPAIHFIYSKGGGKLMMFSFLGPL